MRSVFRVKSLFSGKKLGIADTAKVIQDKIINITQVVLFLSSPRTTSRSSELSSALVMVLPELLDSTKSKPVKWSSSDLVSEVWLSTWKLTMWESSSSVMIGTISLIQGNPIRRHSHKNRSYCRCSHWRRNVRKSI